MTRPIIYTVVGIDYLGPFRKVYVRRRRSDEPFLGGYAIDTTIGKGDRVVIDSDDNVRRA